MGESVAAGVVLLITVRNVDDHLMDSTLVTSAICVTFNIFGEPPTPPYNEDWQG